jgi:DNA-binding NarL/FixJ family response regulator
VKVLIVDDVEALRLHVRDLVSQVVPSARVSLAVNGAEGLSLYKSEKPDFVVMDIVMPEMSGIKAAQEIWTLNPRTKILFWSQFQRESYVRELGKIVPDEAIHGYALKTEPDKKLLYAIESILLHDNPYIDPIVRGVQKSLSVPDSTITESEYSVLIGLVLGLTDRGIAMREHISVRGVQNRISSLSDKLVRGADLHLKETAGVELYNTRVRIVLEAFRRGLIDQDMIDSLDKELDSWLARRFNFEKNPV